MAAPCGTNSAKWSKEEPLAFWASTPVRLTLCWGALLKNGKPSLVMVPIRFFPQDLRYRVDCRVGCHVYGVATQKRVVKPDQKLPYSLNRVTDAARDTCCKASALRAKDIA